jgi:hypothetical protein
MTTRNSRQSGSVGPRRARLVLAALILVAAVANLNLAVANVALPSIGAAFDASQRRSISSPSGTRSPRCCPTDGRGGSGRGGVGWLLRSQ